MIFKRLIERLRSLVHSIRIARLRRSVKICQLDDFIHVLRTSGILRKLTDQQVENISYALQCDPRFINTLKLDHVINELRLSRELNKLTPQAVENILFSLRSLGFLENFKDVSQSLYADEYLISYHQKSFMDDRFMRAYQSGCDTYSWFQFEMPWAVYILCWAADYAKVLEGDYVEYGARRGGFAITQSNYVDFSSLSTKSFYLLDTFLDHYSDDTNLPYKEALTDHFSFYDDVCQTFAKYQNIKLIKGITLDSCTEVQSNKICYLSINTFPLDNETRAIEYFWDKLVSKAIIVLGDYKLCHEFAKVKHHFVDFARKKNVEILSLPTGQGIIIKP